VKYAKLYQVPFQVRDISYQPFAVSNSQTEYVHLAEIDENGYRLEEAMCGFSLKPDLVPGYKGVWAENYPDHGKFVPCPKCTASQLPPTENVN
jgi:hypothetical protein